MFEESRIIKCVVWDLDDTIWKGTLLEENVTVNIAVCDVIKELDDRGILHSIASRNDRRLAEAKLAEIGMLEYFLCPQIGWSAKSIGIGQISEELALAPEAMAFVDDQEYERAEVAFEYPEVLCVDSRDAMNLPRRSEFTPLFSTAESRTRRAMYVADAARREASDNFTGPREEFLRSLDLRVEIGPAVAADLQRAAELTARTHQMNTTGRAYSHDQLTSLLLSERHVLTTMQLTDKFGSYGTIGLAMVEKEDVIWTIKLLLVSCRVANRGVATVFMSHLKRMARRSGAKLLAEIVPNERNRPMYISLVMNGFTYSGRDDDLVYLTADLSNIPDDPCYLALAAGQSL